MDDLIKLLRHGVAGVGAPDYTETDRIMEEAADALKRMQWNYDWNTAPKDTKLLIYVEVNEWMEYVVVEIRHGVVRWLGDDPYINYIQKTPEKWMHIPE